MVNECREICEICGPRNGSVFVQKCRGGISAEFLVLSFELHVISLATFVQNMLVARSENIKA